MNNDCNVIDNEISHYLHVKEFQIHSVYAKFILLYHISIHLHKHYKKYLSASSIGDNRFVEVEKLDISIHYGPHTAVSYKVKFGKGYKLPCITHNTCDE